MPQKESQAVVGGQTSGPGPATVQAPAQKPTKPHHKPKQLPPYKVLLHNDDVNTVEHVIVAILKVTTLQPEEAVLKTVEAHETGVSLLLVSHKERAELYVEQFATFNITVSIEPDGG